MDSQKTQSYDDTFPWETLDSVSGSIVSLILISVYVVLIVVE